MAFVVSAVIAAFEVGAATAVILTAVTEVGLSCTVVGAVTGNKDLMKVGSVLGIVGGVGSLINAGIGALAEGTASNALANQATQEAGTSLAEFGGKEIAENVGGDAVANTVADTSANTALNATTNALPVVNGAVDTADSVSSLATPMPTTPYGMSSSNALTDAGSAESLNGVDANGLSPNYANAPNSPTVADGTNNASNVVNNVQNTGSQFVTDDARQKAMEATDGYGIQSSSNVGTGATGGIVDSLKSGVDATSQWFKGLQPQAQSEILKSLMAVPGGIQQQKNAAAQLAIQQQRNNFTVQGGQVPRYGIIASNQKG